MSEGTEIVKAEPQRAELAIRPMGGMLCNSLAEVKEMAGIIATSGLVPRDMNTPEKVTVAILWGRELGLSPMQAIQSIAVINGRPSLYGDALPAIVLASPVCEYIAEEFKGEGEETTAVCRSKRRNSPAEKVTTFSVIQAKRAGLWGKAGPWTQYPRRMLQVRARSQNLRDNFADVLRGFGVYEEQRDVALASGTVAAEIVDDGDLPASETQELNSELFAEGEAK